MVPRLYSVFFGFQLNFNVYVVFVEVACLGASAVNVLEQEMEAH